MKKSNLIPLLLGMLLLTGCAGKDKNARWKSPVPGYRQIPVTRTDLQITVLSTGNVQPNNELVIYPPISGRIEKIMIKEGDSVRKGQKLMDLSSTERATVLDEAANQGASQLAHWEQYYQETPLLSPENGEIIYLPTVPGQIVSTGVTLMVMSDHLMVDTQVDETDLAQIKMGQDATITLDAYPDNPIEGKVHRISYFSTLVNNVTTYEVDVWPAQIPAFMRSGMTANVVFNISEKDDVLAIPSEALQQSGGQTGVYIEDPDHKGKPKFIPIQTGITDGKQTEVVSGLNEDDKILIKTFSAGQLSQGASTGSNPFMPNARGTGTGGGGNRSGGGGGGH
jgi:macrolide-specific efflux system membrane fusion protein